MEQNQNPGLFGLEIDDISSRNLINASKWAKFLAITAVVGLGLILLFFLIYGNQIAQVFANLLPGMEGSVAMGAITAVIVIVILIFGLLAFLLLRASLLIQKGIRSVNQEVFNNGLAALKMYFIIYGILTCLGLFMNLISLF